MVETAEIYPDMKNLALQKNNGATTPAYNGI